MVDLIVNDLICDLGQEYKGIRFPPSHVEQEGLIPPRLLID